MRLPGDWLRKRQDSGRGVLVGGLREKGRRGKGRDLILREEGAEPGRGEAEPAASGDSEQGQEPEVGASEGARRRKEGGCQRASVIGTVGELCYLA
eukprot:1580180-Rhodomonas_salina.2